MFTIIVTAIAAYMLIREVSYKTEMTKKRRKQRLELDTESNDIQKEILKMYKEQHASQRANAFHGSNYQEPQRNNSQQNHTEHSNHEEGKNYRYVKNAKRVVPNGRNQTAH